MGYTRTNLTGAIRASDFNETRLAIAERAEVSGTTVELPPEAAQGDRIRAYHMSQLQTAVTALAESQAFLIAHASGVKLDADHYDTLPIGVGDGARYVNLSDVLSAINSPYTAWPRWYGARPYVLGSPTDSGLCLAKDICLGVGLELIRAVLSSLVWTPRTASWVTPKEYEVYHQTFYSYETSREAAYDAGAAAYPTGWPNGIGGPLVTPGCMSQGVTYEALWAGWACDIFGSRIHQKSSVDLYGLPTEVYDRASTIRWRMYCEAPVDGSGGNEFDANSDTGVAEDTWGTFCVDSSVTGQVRYSSTRQGGTSQPVLSTGPRTNGFSYQRGYRVSDDCDVILQWEDGFDYP